MNFTQFLSIPELAARYKKIKPFFALRSSAYDVSADCQLRCANCSYFASSMSHAKGEKNPEQWRRLMESEKKRGINYVNLAGAEPSLVPGVLRACHDVIPQGAVVTNGLKPIPHELTGYRIHISIWGDSATDPLFRPYQSGKPAIGTLAAALDSYAGDSRVVFVYTFNAHNIAAADETAARIAAAGHQLTFSVFTTSEAAPDTPLRVAGSLDRIRAKMLEIMDRYPESVVYSHYNAEVHTHPQGLRDQFGCVFPRAAQSAGGVSSTYRSYRADLTHIGDASCCTPEQSCADCRVYAAGAVIVPASLHSHARSEQSFRGWLDYVDTFLAVYVTGYRKDAPLYRGAHAGVPA